MKIYISGKITGLDLIVAESNFEKVEAGLKSLGHIPINPMKILAFHPDLTWEDYMCADIRELFTCDAIFLMQNWTDSRGARIEKAIAETLGLKIFHFRDVIVAEIANT